MACGQRLLVLWPMAVIRPFRAWRYAPALLQEPQQVLSPMTDGFDEAFFHRLYTHTHSSLHLSLPRAEQPPHLLAEQWMAQGILQQDPMPAFYPFYQTFSLFGEAEQQVRRGFLALVKIGPEPGSDSLVAHEGTLPAGVEARRRGLEECQLQVTPTHGLYSDPYYRIEELLDAYQQSPLLDATDFQGVRSSLSMAAHKQDLDLMREVLLPKKIFVADGHHRLAASRALLQQALADDPYLPEDHPYRYHLMYLSNLRSQDLRILPIHRVVHLPPDLSTSELMADLQHLFHITPHNSRQPLYEAMKGHLHTFGLVWQGRQLLLRLREELDPLELVEPDMPSSVKYLDYTLLHYLVFDKMLGIPWAEQARSSAIRYVAQYNEAVRLAQTTPGTMGIIVNGVEMRQLLAVCNDGWLMPPKSTFFYPKLVCGLTFAGMTEADFTSGWDELFQ